MTDAMKSELRRLNNQAYATLLQACRDGEDATALRLIAKMTDALVDGNATQAAMSALEAAE